MAEKIGELYYDLTIKDDKFNKTLKASSKTTGDFDKKVSSTGLNIKKMGTFAKVAAVAGIAMFALAMRKAVKDATDLEETTNKFNVVFGEVQTEAEKMATILQESYGASREGALDALSATGDLLTGMGMQQKAALDLSFATTTLAEDLASFTNIEGGAARVSAALTSAMTGEREALKSVGVIITEKMIKDELMRKGQDKLTGSALMQAKAEATLAIAIKQSGNAIGDKQRSFDSFANVQKRVENRLTDMSAKLGAELTPALGDLGLAFLESSKDGGTLASVFEMIVDAANLVVKSISSIIRMWDLFGGIGKTSAAEEHLEKLNANYDMLIKKAKEELKIRSSNKNEIKEQINLIANQKGNALQIRALDYQKAIYLQQQKINVREKEFVDLVYETSNIEESIKGIWEEKSKEVDEALEKRKKEIALAKLQTQKEKERLKAEKTANKEREKQAALNEKKTEKQDAQVLITSILDPMDEIEKQKQQQLAQLEAFNFKKLGMEEEYQEAKAKIEKNAAVARAKLEEDEAKAKKERNIQQAFTTLSTVSSQLGQLGELYNMSAENNIARIDNETQVKMDAIEKAYNTEKETIENSLLSEDEKNKQLKALDEKRARDEKKIEDKAAKDKRKIAYDNAVIQKKLTIATTLMSIPAAAFAAFKSLAEIPVVGYGLGLAAATATTALGLAKVAMISQQPLPQLAEGGYIGATPGGRDVTIGEGRYDEAVIPLSEAFYNRLGNGITNALGKTNSESGTLTAISNNDDDKIINLNLTIDTGSETFFTKIENAIANRDIVIELDNLAGA